MDRRIERKKQPPESFLMGTEKIIIVFLVLRGLKSYGYYLPNRTRAQNSAKTFKRLVIEKDGQTLLKWNSRGRGVLIFGNVSKSETISLSK